MKNLNVDFKYTGVDNLEAMLEAERYNMFLMNQVLRYRSGGGSVLDFGAGIGTFSTMIGERGIQVDCVEVDKQQSDALKRKGLRVFEDTGEIPSESYDYVFSLNVFEHIEDDQAAMTECRRILRPGGRVFTYVPAFKILFGDMDRKVEHYRRYTRQSLEDLAEKAGLEFEKSAYVDIAGFFATMLYNISSNGSGDISKSAVRNYDRYVFPASRALDLLTHRFIGKNVFSVARKRA